MEEARRRSPSMAYAPSTHSSGSGNSHSHQPSLRDGLKIDFENHGPQGTNTLHPASTIEDTEFNETALALGRTKLSGDDRRRAAKFFYSLPDHLSTTNHDRFDDSKFKHGVAVNFPEIPGEAGQNDRLRKIREKYNTSRDPDGSITPELILPKSRARGDSSLDLKPIDLRPARDDWRGAPNKDEHTIQRYLSDAELKPPPLQNQARPSFLSRRGPPPPYHLSTSSPKADAFGPASFARKASNASNETHDAEDKSMLGLRKRTRHAFDLGKEVINAEEDGWAARSRTPPADSKGDISSPVVRAQEGDEDRTKFQNASWVSGPALHRQSLGKPVETADGQPIKHISRRIKVPNSNDFGYASVSLPGLITEQPARISLLRGKEVVGNTRIEAQMNSKPIVSDNEHARSLLSVDTARETMAEKLLISLCLFEDRTFRRLAERSIKHVGRDGFIDHLARTLKRLHEGILSDSRSNALDTTVMHLGSLKARIYISHHIADLLETGPDRPELGMEDGDIARMEVWLSNIVQRTTPLHYTAGGDLRRGKSSESDDQVVLPPQTTTLKQVILNGKPFQFLLRDFMLLHLPAELRTVVLSIPKGDVRLSGDQKNSIIDEVKLQMVARTGVEWNWWPLAPPKRRLEPNEKRLSWRCTCGRWRWAEISHEQYEMASRILQMPHDETQPPYPCIKRTKANAVSSIQANVSSSAATRYTPSSEGTPETSSQSSYGVASAGTRPTSVSSGSGDSGSKELQPQVTRPGTSEQPVSGSTTLIENILFGAKGPRRTLSPDQIQVDQHTTDHTFYRDLKACYQRCRGFWRVWFSIWRLEYCHVAKFKRLSHDRMVHEHKDLPIDGIYKYAPRAGTREARNPPISAHLFQAMYYVCDSTCKWPQFLHDCMTMSAGSHTRDSLDRIPKRDMSFQFDQTREIWGLEAVFAVSFAYVMVYHCILVFGPFVFWAWWLGQSPGDWQNASVPFTVVLGGLSAFWSSTGILGGQG